MFFTQRKVDVLPMLQGFVDIHCHVLPAIDDGAKDVIAAMELIDRYREMGFSGLYVTPHIMYGIYPNTTETITKAVSSLNEEYRSFLRGVAAEHMIDEGLQKLLGQKALMVLKNRYVLTEMSYAQKPSNLKSVLFDILQAGYRPILAHPERYNFYSDIKEYERLKELGFEFQLNILSLSEHYGVHVQKKAFRLLKEGLFDYVGTDTHRLDHLHAIERLTIPKKYAKAFGELIESTKGRFSV